VVQRKIGGLEDRLQCYLRGRGVGVESCQTIPRLQLSRKPLALRRLKCWNAHFLKSPLVMGVMRRLGKRLDGRRQLAVTAQYIRTFFDVNLQGAPASKLQSQPEYPEIEYVH
jgi:hypothetical protein